MKHPDEIEEMNFQFDFQDEQQRALEISKRKFAKQHDDKIAQALAKGKHVVIITQNAYCSSTDAYIGQHKSFLDAFDDRKLAERKMQSLFDSDSGLGDEHDLDILPHQPKLQAVIQIDDSEIPF